MLGRHPALKDPALRHSDYAAIIRALAKAPAVIDIGTSQIAVSSDAEKGLGFMPHDRALTAWDDAERRRRGEI